MHKVVTDDYIDKLFDGCNFGDKVNASNVEKRKLIAKGLRNQLEGYWSGHTLYQIMTRGGFLQDAKTDEPKRLTALGAAFLEAGI